jgi:hypothetical protein
MEQTRSHLIGRVLHETLSACVPERLAPKDENSSDQVDMDRRNTRARGLPVGERDGERQSDDGRGARPPDREAALLVAPHGALHCEAALHGPGDAEGARQPERAEQERGEHGQGDKPTAWSPLRRRRRRHGKP